jgi:hypothetical protein
MSPVEIIALITAILMITKALMFFFRPKSWYGFVNNFININGIRWIYFLVALTVFYFVIQEVSVIQFLAVMIAVAGFYGSVLFGYKRQVKLLVKEAMKDRLKTNWIQMIIGVILAVWVLISLF